MTNDVRNPYAPPNAPLEKPAELESGGGSIEDAVAGRYDFTIGEVMSEAWGLVHGFKGVFWGVALVIYIFSLAASFALDALVSPLFDGTLPLLQTLLVNSISAVLLAPLNVGISVIAVRRAAGLPNSFGMAFVGLARIPVFVGAALLTLLLTYVGFALLVIPGIYLVVAYVMAQPLLAFRNMPVWTAMEVSRRTITHKWFRVFGLSMVVGLISGLSALLLLIPLIWTLPWAVLVVGVLYRRMFGAPVAAS